MKNDELSSTEKLLEQIRGNKPSSISSPPSGSPVAPSPGGWQDHLRSALKFNKPIRIGVDIGYNDVRLIKTVQATADHHQILDCRHVPFDPGLDPQNLLFPQFLRNTLTSFIGSTEAVSIWATTSSAQLDTRLLRVPKVARRQIPNAVKWAYKKKNPYDDKQRLFDFEVHGETTAGDTPQIEVLAYTIPREDIDTIKTAFSRAGYTLDGVSTYPFLLQNLLRTRWKILGQGNLCALYIGRNWSRIDLFNNGTLMLSRGIRAGMNSMVEAIKADPRIASETNPEATLEMDFRPIPTPSTLPNEASDLVPTAVLACLVPGLGSAAEKIPIDHLALRLEPDDVFAMIRPALDRLNRQVERTIGHYAINFEHREIDRLCVSGLICESERVRNYIAEQLGIPLVDLNPFDSETLPGRPDTQQEQLSYIPAVGLASAGDSPTPNFLQTYHDRSKREKRQLFNSILFGLFLLAMLGFLGYTGWQKHHLLAKHKQMINLQQKLEEFVPLLNPETVLILAAKAKEATGRLTQRSDKYRGVAIIADLARMTPPDILMTKIAIRLPRREGTAEKKSRRVLSIGGVIRGERLDLEPTLAAYMVKMKASPLLSEPRIVDKTFEMLGGREVLRFTAELEII